MDEIHVLLSKRWVLRRKNPDMYYKLKDNFHLYSEFFKQKLGYNIIINPLLIKAEKIPGSIQSFMGIKEINQPKGYVFLCLILMFLEEKDQGEQFVLAQVIDYVKNQYPNNEIIDWTVYSNRKQLIHVLRLCIGEGMILINDGDDKHFSNSESSLEVLYENTGASKYFMRRFPFDINEVKSYKDFSDLEWQSEEKDRGLVRRHRVYRRLMMEPVVYQKDEDDQDYLYIKSQRSVIANDTEKYLDGDFHLHKNGAMVLLKDQNTNSLPNRKNISDIVIQLCSLICEEIKDISRDSRDFLTISDAKWEMYLKKLIEKYVDGWSKSYRDMVFSSLKKEISEVMSSFGMIEIISREIVLLPMIGKIKGNYPKEFWEKNNGKMENK